VAENTPETAFVTGRLPGALGIWPVSARGNGRAALPYAGQEAPAPLPGG